MNVEKFKNNFGGESIGKIIDYIVEKKEFFKEDLINVGIKSRIKRNKCSSPSSLRRAINFFIRINLLIEKNDKLIFNEKFMPLDQTCKKYTKNVIK